MNVRPLSLDRTLSALAALALVGLLVAAGLALSPRGKGRQAVDEAARAGAARAVAAELPLRFVPNAGQADARVRFIAHGRGHAAFFTAEAVVLASLDGAADRPAPRPATRPVSLGAEPRGEAVALVFVGADPGVQIEGRRELRGRAHYMTGRARSAWRSELPTFGEVVYRELWPGVDMVFRQSRGRLKYELVVAPGARPEAIRLAYRGAERVDLDGAGNLRLRTARGVRQEPRPVSYQEVGGRRVPVESRFAVAGAGRPDAEVSFALGAYDRRRPLVIDPALVYSTFLGGSNTDEALAVAVDSDGHVYVAGFTVGSAFPDPNGDFLGHPGGSEVFVAKLDPLAAGDDSLIYSTILGGSVAEQATAIAVDETGSAYVTGFTQSSNFPITDGSGGSGAALDGVHNGNTDAFLVKLSPSGGALRYASFLGGQFDELGMGIALRTVGTDHEVYLTGLTDSPDLPGADPDQFNGGVLDPTFADAYAVKIVLDSGNEPTLAWATFIGGANDDTGTGIAVDGDGHAVVVGTTRSADFPVTGTAFDTTYNTNIDAFVAKLDADGACCLYATYLGGPGADEALAVALDVVGHVYVTGRAGAGFPTSPGAFATGHSGGEDVFVARIDTSAAGAASRVYATYVGGSGDERGHAIAVAPNTGLAFVAGKTSSPDFPVTAGAISGTLAGHDDVFLVSVHPSGDSVLYGTYLGGPSFDVAFGLALEPGNADNAAVVGAGQTGFPATSSAFQEDYGGSTDAFVVRLRLAPQLCLGHLQRDTRRVFRPDACLTCPPDRFRIVSRILVAELNAARTLVERGNRRAVTAALGLFRRELALLARLRIIPSSPAADLGLAAAECNRVFIAEQTTPTR